MRGIYNWGCRFDSFLTLLLSVPYYIQTSSGLFPCSPCHLSLRACRSLCIVVRALGYVRSPSVRRVLHAHHVGSAFPTLQMLQTLRMVAVWLPRGFNAAHGAPTPRTERQCSPSVAHGFFFADERHRNATTLPTIRSTASSM
jgi:hypothetical protein